MSNVGEILSPRGRYLSLEKGKENFGVVFAYFIKRAREVRRFYVAVVQRRLRNVQKSVMHAMLILTYCFFAILVAVDIVVAQESLLLSSKNFATMVTLRHTSLCYLVAIRLLGGELTSCWRFRWWRDDRTRRTEGRTLTDCGDPCSSYPFFATVSVELNTMPILF